MIDPFPVADPVTETVESNHFSTHEPDVSVSTTSRSLPEEDDGYSEIIIHKPDNASTSVGCRFDVVVESDHPVTVDVFAGGKQVTRDDAGKTGTKKLANVVGTKTYTGIMNLCGLNAGTWLNVVVCEDLPPPHNGICDFVQKKLSDDCDPCEGDKKPRGAERMTKPKKAKPKPAKAKKAKPAAKKPMAKAKPAKAKKAKPAAKKAKKRR